MSLWAEGVNEFTIPFDLRFSQMRSAVEGQLRPDDPRRSVLRESKSELTYGKLRDLNAQLDAEWAASHDPVLRKLRGDYFDARRRLHQISLEHRQLVRRVGGCSHSPDREILRDLPPNWNVDLPPVAEGDVEFSSEAEGRAALATMLDKCTDAETRCTRLRNILFYEQSETSAKNRELVLALFNRIQKLEGQLDGLKRYVAQNLESKAFGKGQAARKRKG